MRCAALDYKSMRRWGSDFLLVLLYDSRQWRTAIIMGVCGCLPCFCSFALLFNGATSLGSLVWNCAFCSLIGGVAASICVGPLGGRSAIAILAFVAPYAGLIFLAVQGAPLSRAA